MQEHADYIEEAGAGYGLAAITAGCRQHDVTIAGALTGTCLPFADTGSTQITGVATGADLICAHSGVIVLGEMAQRLYLETTADGGVQLSALAAKFLGAELPVFASQHPSALLCSFPPRGNTSSADQKVCKDKIAV